MSDIVFQSRTNNEIFTVYIITVNGRTCCSCYLLVSVLLLFIYFLKAFNVHLFFSGEMHMTSYIVIRSSVPGYLY